MPDFVHLHLHTEYSLLDGACRIAPLVERAAELGQKALAVTDHGNMFGAVEFFKAAKKAGIKPIIGCEVYVAPRSMSDKQKGADSENRHLVLLCRNEEGYKNLIYLVSEAWTRGFYSRPRVDRRLLAEHSGGLVALSACLSGEVAARLRGNDFAGALQAALWYKSVYGEDYYLELQDQGIPEQKEVNAGILSISRRTGIKVVATNDVHYIKPEDAEIQRILLCIQTNTTVDDGKAMEFPTKEFYLKSGDEMLERFRGVSADAVFNTAEVADKCNFEFEFGKTKLPNFTTPPDCPDHAEYLRRQALAGFEKRYPGMEKAALKRLYYELDVINRMGYTDYFLIVADFIAYARSRGIPVGPGRGSGASSLVGYCLGITGVDPMRYDLMFERFLNPERVSMPDFDIDFCQERRQEVIDYVVGKYGSDHVAQIVTFGTMKARAAVRDVGRALGMSYAAVDAVAKLIPHSINGTLDGTLAEPNSPLAAACAADPAAKRLIDTARGLEGMTRHASTHAAGVVVTDEPANRLVPLAVNGDAVVTQYTMNYLEELGLLKIDFLGLRYLTVIHDAEAHVKKNEPDFDIEKIPEDDAATYKMIGAGDTDGVFQLESGGMRQMLTEMKPCSLDDLLAAISLYRPGPMESIPRYLAGRADPRTVKYHHPKLEASLKSTYGVIVYQEQVTQICRDIAGYSYGQADMVRRAMAKKKVAEMERQKKRFIYGEPGKDGAPDLPGAIENGVDEATAEKIFAEMETFAGYGFNKCHAAPYALIAYRTAYLRANKYNEYMAALISSMAGDPKAAAYIEDCKRHGAKVLPPDVNACEREFTPAPEGVRFGLLGIKNLGVGVIDEIIRRRRTDGRYTSFYDFCSRNCGREMNIRALESLIKAGALDCLGATRRSMMTCAPTLLAELSERERVNVEGQLGLFGGAQSAAAPEYEMPVVGEFSAEEMLAMEREVTGLFLSSHPLDGYAKQIKDEGITLAAQLTGGDAAALDGRRVTLLGVVAGRTSKQTKNGGRMAFVTLEDKTDRIELVVFSELLSRCSDLLAEGRVVRVSGRVSVRENDEQEDAPPEVKLVAETVSPPSAPPVSAPRRVAKPVGKAGVYIKVSGERGEDFRQAKLMIKYAGGTTPLYVYFKDIGKLTRAPSSLWVTANNALISQLSELLGAENVKNVTEEKC